MPALWAAVVTLVSTICHQILTAVSACLRAGKNYMYDPNSALLSVSLPPHPPFRLTLFKVLQI